MAKMTTAEMIEAIKELSVLELNELVKACEEEFGVSAAAGQAPLSRLPSAPPSGGPPESQSPPPSASPAPLLAPPCPSGQRGKPHSPAACAPW